jgi:Na+-translocating ferredoxin:NAD+ oxidoreductase RnfG subunit
MNDLLLFAATATLFTFYVKRVTTEKITSCDAAIKNSAFVFIKPHANTPSVQRLVREKLTAAGCTILSELEIDGKTIDEQKLIDQHYYAIGTLPYI